MTATMIKMDNGFFISKLEGFNDIQKDCIKVNIDLVEEEYSQLSYKELKGIAIMEKYYNKLENQIKMSENISDIQKEFRIKNNIVMDLEQYLRKS
jgi:hypothetical protein